MAQTLSLCKKNYKFDLEVKSQRCIEIMNVCDTLSHVDTPICQIWYANVNAKKNVTGQILICTNRRTDRAIPIHPLNFVLGGFIEESHQSVINTRDICSGELNL